MNRTDAILTYLTEYVAANDYGPTLDEIAEACGLSSKAHADYWMAHLLGLGQVRQVQKVRGWRVK